MHAVQAWIAEAEADAEALNEASEGVENFPAGRVAIPAAISLPADNCTMKVCIQGWERIPTYPEHDISI